VARIGAQVAEALDYAAGQGILHRDIKPSNLLLDLQGNVWVTDFGLAKATAGEEGLTHPGDIVGTLRYMAPERFQGRSDIRSDLYSLGLTLYELLVQRPAFTETDRSKLIHQLTHEEPVPPRRLESAIPRDLETVVLKAIARDPAHRYQAAGGLAEDLKRFGEDRPIKARRVGVPERLWRWSRRNPALASLTAAVVVLLLAGTGLSTYFAMQAEAEAKNARLRAEEALVEKRRADQSKEEAFTQKSRADAEAERANEKAAEATNALNKARRLHAVSLLRQSQVAWRDNNARLAGALLQEVPEDLRGWEWTYLRRLYRGGYLTLYGHSGAVASVTMSPDGARLATGSWDGTAKIWDAVIGRELITLKGHTDRVLGVAFSPNGRRVVTASADKTAKVWDVVTGRELLTLNGHTDSVFGVAFSPDGRRLATASGRIRLEHEAGEDCTAKVWDAVTGRELQTLRGHTGSVFGVAFSPDGRQLATASADKTAKVWDVRTGREILSLQGHTSALFGVAFSPDGQRIATTGIWEQTVKIWDARTGREILTLRGHTRWVLGVAFSPDGQRLATGSDDGMTKLWDVRTGQELLTLKGHTASLWSVCFSSDGQRLATASGDATVKIWDMRVGQEALTLQGFPRGVSDVAFSPDGQRLASAGGTRYASVGGNDLRTAEVMTKVWDASTGQELLALTGKTGAVISVAFSPDGRRLATGSEDGTTKLWDAHSGQELVTIQGHTDRVRTVAFRPDGRRLATASWDGTTKLWDPETGQILLSINEPANRVAFSPDGQRLVTADRGQKRTATVWDAHSGQKLLMLELAGEPLGVAFSPDGHRLATTSGDGIARIWDAASGRQIFNLTGHSGGVDGVAFSPDGHHLATSSWDGTVKIWDALSGQELLTLTGHAGPVYCVVFSRDGWRLATGSNDRTVRVWDARPIQEPLALKGHTVPVYCVAFSPDGRQLATSGADRTVRVLDVGTGRELLPPKEHPGYVSSVAFSPDGERLAGAGGDGMGRAGLAMVWEVRSGRELHTLRGHTAPMQRVVFSPDGQRLATTSFDETTMVWDLQSGKSLTDPDAAKFLPLARDPALSPDGRLLARPDGAVVYFHDLKQPPDAEEIAYRQAMARVDPVWQQEHVARDEQLSQWFAVAFHLDQALAARPDLPLHFRRGRARAELAQWARAEVDFAQAVRQEPDRIAAWRGLGLTQLALSREEDYRQTCGRLREHFAARDGLSLAELCCLAAPPWNNGCPTALIGAAALEVQRLTARVARLCTLRPGAVADPAGLLPWAPADPIARGALLYRAGRTKESVPLLRGRTEATALLYLALAEQACAAPREAKQHLEDATRWLTAPSREDPKQTNADRLPWDERLEIDLLRGEAQALLALSSPST
jgi:WD40 repeat protein